METIVKAQPRLLERGGRVFLRVGAFETPLPDLEAVLRVVASQEHVEPERCGAQDAAGRRCLKATAHVGKHHFVRKRFGKRRCKWCAEPAAAGKKLCETHLAVVRKNVAKAVRAKRTKG